VIGTSKGKGFAGGVKRYHFGGGPKTHGQSDRQRAPGSVGGTTSPGRVYKGTRMAGHLGASRITVRNVEVAQADPGRNLIVIKGAVPGPVGSVVLIKKAVKRR
jgi:large subunit ribosomal protein L3